jgi:hypothetical protein
MPSNKTATRSAARSPKSGRFILGRAAFRKVSAVEGIVVPDDLAQDLQRLSKSAPAKRRSALSEKYGKK